MGKKLALNVLYNIGLIICLAVAYWSFGGKHYEYILAAAFGGAILIVLKIKLIKEIKNSGKP